MSVPPSSNFEAQIPYRHREDATTSMSTTSTITAYITHTAIATNTSTQEDFSIAEESPHPSTRFYIFVFSSLTIWLISRYKKHQKTLQEQANSEAYVWSWKTRSWTALYGLLSLSYKNKSTRTPFLASTSQSIYERWPNPHRIALHRLLEKGIIPLSISDGGISTSLTKALHFESTFPYIRLPAYQQVKSRAYFDFLVVHPEEKRRAKFLQLVCENRHKYGVSVCDAHEDIPYDVEYAEENPPYRGNAYPLSVGAEAVLEPLLPFLKDRVVRTGEELGPLGGYFKDGNTRSVPLLHHAPTLVVRIESCHWGWVELDQFVNGCAEKARLGSLWPVDAT